MQGKRSQGIGPGAWFLRILAAAAIAATLIFCGLGFLHPPVAGMARDPSSASTDEGLSVWFLDVGQGDAAFLSCGGSTMLIDGGTSKYSDFIYSWLKQHQISDLTYIVSSHPDEDHIGGLSGALHAAHAEHALSPVAEDSSTGFQNFRRFLAEQGTEIEVPEAGSTFSFGDAEVEVLGPVDRTAPETNNLSLVLRIAYGNTSFLFTGDMEDREEADLLAGTSELRSTVLKVSHHGSANGTTYSFLYAVDPEYAVLSVGKDNPYGHPSEKVMDLLSSAGICIYRTDEMGTIHAESDGMKVTFHTEKDAVSGEENGSADTFGETASAGEAENSGGSDSGDEAGYAVSETAGAAGLEAAGSAGPEAAGTKGLTAGSAEDCDYVLNVNSHKFHRPECRSVANMKEKNKRFVKGSRDAVIADGYEPCKICNP